MLRNLWKQGGNVAAGESSTHAPPGEHVFYCFLVRAACGAAFQSEGTKIQQKLRAATTTATKVKSVAVLLLFDQVDSFA